MRPACGGRCFEQVLPLRHGHCKDEDVQDGLERGIGHGRRHIAPTGHFVQNAVTTSRVKDPPVVGLMGALSECRAGLVAAMRTPPAWANGATSRRPARSLLGLAMVEMTSLSERWDGWALADDTSASRRGKP